MRRWTIRDRDYRLNPAIIQRSEETFVEVSSPGDHFEFPGGFAVLKNPGAESDYALNLAATRIQEEEARFDVFNGNSVRASVSPQARGSRSSVFRSRSRKNGSPFEEEKGLSDNFGDLLGNRGGLHR